MMEHNISCNLTRQGMPEGAAIQSRRRQSKLCQCRTVSRCDLYNDGFLPAPGLASFSLLFNNRFCRIWLADRWHMGMSRKGTCILSYQFPYFHGRKGQAPRRVELDCAGFMPTRETTASARQNRASPVDKRTAGMPSRRSAAGWSSECKSTEEAFVPEVELWTAFLSEKNINFVHLPLFAKCRSVFIEMVALWTR